MSRNYKAEASWHRNRMKGCITYAANFMKNLAHHNGRMLTVEEVDIIVSSASKLTSLVSKENWKNYNDFIKEGSYASRQ